MENEETLGKACFVLIAAALYATMWWYGGASVASAIVALLLGTLLLWLLAAPISLALFASIKLIHWIYRRLAQP